MYVNNVYNMQAKKKWGLTILTTKTLTKYSSVFCIICYFVVKSWDVHRFNKIQSHTFYWISSDVGEECKV